MTDTEPLDLDAIEADLNIYAPPMRLIQTTRDLIAEVRRMREAMQSALDDIEGYGGDILWKALHPEEGNV